MKYHEQINQIGRGSRTPWGTAQRVDYITPWLTQVFTAGHGGFKVDRKHNALIVQSLRAKGGWYEEDCDWQIIFDQLAQEVEADCFDFSKEKAARLIEASKIKRT